MKRKQQIKIEYIKIPLWTLDRFDLKVTEGLLYGFILGYGCIVWDYEYIARVLHVTKKTVFNTITSLKDKGIIYIEKIEYGNKARTIIVALYRDNERINNETLRKEIAKGKIMLDAYYYKKNTKVVPESVEKISTEIHDFP